MSSALFTAFHDLYITIHTQINVQLSGLAVKESFCIFYNSKLCYCFDTTYFFLKKSFLWQTLGFGKFSLLGWSDGGITALVAAARNPDLINKMVVWGANAFVSQQDLKLYNGVSRFIALDKWQVIRATNWLSLDYVRVVCLCVNGYVVGTLRGA